MGFRHTVYRVAADEPGNPPLHVYLEGDGTPYIRGGLAAADPTPREPVALRLLALDRAPALLLGRPCYHGLAQSPACSEDLWTEARYSERVVASMAAALRNLAPECRSVVLIGFSGGGTLAVLLSRRLPAVTAVVTLASNLDIDAWADVHGYRRLAGSLNPVQAAAAPQQLLQLHYAGAEDRRVPPAIVERAARQTGGEHFLLDGVDHRAGWERRWPGILAALRKRLTEASDQTGADDHVR